MRVTRKKFSFVYLFVSIVVFAALFPFIGILVKQIMHFFLKDPSQTLVSEIQKAVDVDTITHLVEAHKEFIIDHMKIYFQVGIMIVCIFAIVIGQTIKNLLRQKREMEQLLETLKTSEFKVVEMGKDFIANASHELRTPITIIRGFAETLQDLPKISQELLSEITEKIVRTCIRLDKLVKSLLTLADVENMSEERMQKVNLVLLAENCQRNLNLSCPNAHVTLQCEEPNIEIYAEGDLIELAISNLLENGVKYSHEPAQIEMKIQRVDEEVHLSIKDQGIGIAEADLPRIFDRFYTVNKARSRKLGGAGLGLSIVKTIVEKHKGKILVNSELGVGTTFTLIFNKD